MKKLIFGLSLLFAGSLFAQVTHPPTGDVADLATCDAAHDGLLFSVLDGNSTTDCSTGSGTDMVLCICNNGTGWTAAGTGGSGTITAVWTDSSGDVSALTAGSGDSLDATSADSTAPAKAGTATPGTCTLGAVFFETDATAGNNLWLCTATDTWTQVTGGSANPGGSDTQYQYNNSASFGGSVAFTYNDATGQSTHSDNTEPGFTIEHDAGASTSGLFETLRLRTTTTADQDQDIGSCIEWGFTDDTSTNQDLAMICGTTDGLSEDRGEMHFRVWDLSAWKDSFFVDNNGDLNGQFDIRVANGGVLEFSGDLKTVGTNDFYFAGATNTFGFNIAPDTLNVDWSLQGTNANNGALARYYSPNGETRFVWNGDDAEDANLTLYDDSGSASLILRAGSENTSEFEGPIEFIPTDTPPSCVSGIEGALHFDASEQRYKKCDDTLAWVNLEGGAFTPSTIDSDYGAETVTSNWDFTGTNSAATGAWTISSLFNFDGGTEGTLRLPSSASTPGTCTIGDLYNDSDATAGQNLYLCTATDTWTLQGGGSGSPGGSDTQLQYNNGAAFGGISEFTFDDSATGALTWLSDNTSQLPLILKAWSSSTSTGPWNALSLEAVTTAASLSDGYGPRLRFGATDAGGGALQGYITTRRSNGDDTDSEMMFSVFENGAEAIWGLADEGRNFSVQHFGIGSYLKASAACIGNSADRLFHDTDCDTTKDGGEEWLDNAAGGGTPGGSTTEVQFNLASAFAGDSAFTFDGTADELTLGEAGVSAGRLALEDASSNKTCIAQSGDRIFHDTDCDETKDAGEEFIDLTGAERTKTLFSFSAISGEPPVTVAEIATRDTRNGHLVLDFDDSAATDECAIFSRTMHDDYQAGTITTTIMWSASPTATSGDAIWDVQFERVNDNGYDVDSDGFAAAQSATCTTTDVNGEVDYCAVTHTQAQADSIAAGEMFRLKVCRDGNNAADTLSGDAELHRVKGTE
jgi:hypothetical protein